MDAKKYVDGSGLQRNWQVQSHVAWTSGKAKALKTEAKRIQVPKGNGKQTRKQSLLPKAHMQGANLKSLAFQDHLLEKQTYTLLQEPL